MLRLLAPIVAGIWLADRLGPSLPVVGLLALFASASLACRRRGRPAACAEALLGVSIGMLALVVHLSAPVPGGRSGADLLTLRTAPVQAGARCRAVVQVHRPTSGRALGC